jgi:hypothetical protein
MNTRLQLIVLGMMGMSPFAGVAWQVLHYLEGFRRLGHDVFYVEDTGDWSYDAEQDTLTDNPQYTVDYIQRLMAWCGLPGRWAYRAAAQGGRIYGLSESAFERLFERADALINVTGATWPRDEHLRVPVRIYLETDPVLRQIEVAQGDQSKIDLLGAHTHHFSFGENLGAPDCRVPLGTFAFQPTRQPVVLDWWMPVTAKLQTSNEDRFTTVSSWKQSGKDIEWNGETYIWSKHLEFTKFVDLPRRANRPFEIALASKDVEAIALFESHGWRVVDAIGLTSDILPYRDYVLSSRGEFTVAKEQYTRPRSGWFSDRSACYLAAGRPVITQETGFSKFLPTGEGLFAFLTAEDVLAAVETIEGDYALQCQRARDIAVEYFAAEKVLSHLMERAGL